MIKVCAWCNKELDNSSNVEDERISHGICSVCLRKYFDIHNAATLKKLLDKFELPVIVVNSEGDVVSANDKAEKKIGKQSEEINGFKAGIVMDCENSSLPGGCGGNAKCEGCAIRETVMETFKTGNPVFNQTVQIHQMDTDDEEILEMNISTQKINDTILIRIDDPD